MEVHVQRSFVVDGPESDAGATPSSEVPLTLFDLFAPAYHVTVLFAFSPPNPTNAALVAALSAVLPRFPRLTARLGRRADLPSHPCFVIGRGAEGALVVEAAVSSELSDHLPLVPSPDLALLHPPAQGAQHMLQLQINRFACGGLVIASSAHHQAADGRSMGTFLHAWTRTVRGAPPPDRPLPHGPDALVPRRPPRCEFDHCGTEFLPSLPHQEAASRQAVNVHPSEITNLLLHYTGDFVAKLKAGVQNKYTTFETVSTHVWRKITAARGLDGAVRTSIRVSVDGRGRLGADTLPEGCCFGNLVLTASSEVTVAELAGGTLAEAATLVRRGIRSVDRRYFQSFVDFGAAHAGEEELAPVHLGEGNVLSPDVESDSWLRLELHRLELGCGGRLVGLVPAKVPQDGVVVVIPSLRKAGGVEVFVALREKHAHELERIAYSMD